MTVVEQVEAERGLGDTLRDYAGKWVAVLDYEVIASSDSLEGLLGQIEGEQTEGQEPAVFQVARDEDVACFF